jgi:hypothetical protein
MKTNGDVSEANELKTFKDLTFKPHSVGDGLMARLNFKNGYGVSVVRFKIPYLLREYGSYTDNENEWEVAILKDDDICYDTPITSDVLGHQTEDDVTEIMKQVQTLNHHP